MKFEAIQHIPMSQQAHGIDPNHVVFRLRAGRDDLKHCTLFYADRACRLTPVIFSSVEMQVEAQDEWFDYFQVILESPYKRICYYFELDDGTQKLLYYGDFFTDHRVDDRSEYYQLPFNHPADIATPPAWAQDAVVYNIFPDSFATSHRFISGKPSEKEWNGQITHGKLGGTLRGVIENLDYIQELGASCIYLNPIFAAGEYHKYDLLDYHHIDPCFGTDEDFRQLVNDCHARGMRVIIDGVFNHVGWNFFAFDDVVRNGKTSKYKNWFYHLQFPVERPENPETYPTYECFGYERMMPKINTCNPEVQNYFCEVGRYWVREFDIDGWRLDVASEINDGFWRAFRQAVKEEKPECILIGEVWETAQHWLNGDIFDSTMNYDFRKHCRRFFAEQSIDAAEFDARVSNMRMRYKLPVLYIPILWKARTSATPRSGTRNVTAPFLTCCPAVRPARKRPSTNLERWRATLRPKNFFKSPQNLWMSSMSVSANTFTFWIGPCIWMKVRRTSTNAMCLTVKIWVTPERTLKEQK